MDLVMDPSSAAEPLMSESLASLEVIFSLNDASPPSPCPIYQVSCIGCASFSPFAWRSHEIEDVQLANMGMRQANITGSEGKRACLQEEPGVQMPKHKMWLMRCQQESQERDMPLHTAQPPAAQLPCALPGQFTHVSGQTPRALSAPGGFAQPAAPAALPSLALQSLQGPLRSLPELAGQPLDRPCAAVTLPQSTQQPLQPAADSQAALSAVREPDMLPADELPAVRPAAASSGLLAASQVAEPRHESPRDGQAVLRAHMPMQPKHSQQELAQPARNCAGLPVETPTSELPPERVLRPWQALSVASAQSQPSQAAPALSRALPRPMVGLPQGGLPGAPQGWPTVTPSSPGLQNQPLGMHIAMYNMLLLQDPALRAQLPPLPSYLAGEP